MSRKLTALVMTCSIISQPASATNACAAPAITTAASVTTSYGAEYEVHTAYRSANETAVQFIRETPATIAVEGSVVWTRNNEEENIAGASERRFAIGHQYHAMLLHFDDIMENVEPDMRISFEGETRRGRTGRYPSGGEASLIEGNTAERPAGLVMKLPDESPITVLFSDWKTSPAERALPYRIIIRHDENVFTYLYSSIEIENMDAVDFQDRYKAPANDALQIQRLHRSLLTAHCRGDHALMARLSAPASIIANRGDVFETTRDETRTRFGKIFERIKYSGYHDIANPIIRVAESGDIGWATVNVRAEGHEKSSGRQFNQQWAWVMLAERRDGAWVSVGNSSSAAPLE